MALSKRARVQLKLGDWPTGVGDHPGSKWVRSAADEEAIASGYTFSTRHADHMAEMLEKYCVHTAGQWYGEPFRISSWQYDNIVGPLYGWLDERGNRRHRYAYVQAPKKTPGKSTLSAALALMHLIDPRDKGAIVMNVAASQKQAAGVVHGTACTMVELGPLSLYCDVKRSLNRIEFPQDHSQFISIAQKPYSGPSVSFWVGDEVHEWLNDRTYNSLIYADKARRKAGGGLGLLITNAGEDDEQLWHRLYAMAKDYERGDLTDPSWYTFISEPKASGDQIDEEIRSVAMGGEDIPIALSCNPHVGEIVDESDLVLEIREAGKSPWKIPNCKRFVYNHPCRSSELDWLGPLWDENRRDFQPADLEGEACWAGFDRGHTRDFSAMVLLFQFGPEWKQLPFFWVPEQRVRELRALVPIEEWVRNGFLRTFPGNVFDLQLWQDDVVELFQTYTVQSVTFDRYKAEVETQWMEIERIAFGQSHANYNQYACKYEELLATGRMQHNGHPVFSWQAKNAVRAETAKGHVMPRKRDKDDYRTVDGVQAAMMALATALTDERVDYSYLDDYEVKEL